VLADGHSRKLQTQVGEVPLRVPKLRQRTFERAIIERYGGRGSAAGRRGR
jgi:putative transposase